MKAVDSHVTSSNVAPYECRTRESATLTTAASSAPIIVPNVTERTTIHCRRIDSAGSGLAAVALTAPPLTAGSGRRPDVRDPPLDVRRRGRDVRGEVEVPGGGDQDVVLDPHADAAVPG